MPWRTTRPPERLPARVYSVSDPPPAPGGAYPPQPEAPPRNWILSTFQLEEFNAAGLEAGEQEELEEELTRLTNAEDIKTTLAAAFNN